MLKPTKFLGHFFWGLIKIMCMAVQMMYMTIIVVHVGNHRTCQNLFLT